MAILITSLLSRGCFILMNLFEKTY